MTSIEDEFYLDLNKITLFGWESPKLFDKVSCFIDLIEKEEEFPAVPVRKIDENTYSLVWGVKDKNNFILTDGGHHRALAHYITNVPLKCELYQYSPFPDTKIPIKNISLSF
jgi:hypothetical protein